MECQELFVDFLKYLTVTTSATIPISGKTVVRSIPDFIPISADKKTNIDELKDLIFDNLDLVRIYLKPQGKKADMEDPLVIKKGSTVIDACGKLHREFVKNFRHAKVWGTSVKFPGQKVGPDHVLEDEDILRIILKK